MGRRSIILIVGRHAESGSRFLDHEVQASGDRAPLGLSGAAAAVERDGRPLPRMHSTGSFPGRPPAASRLPVRSPKLPRSTPGARRSQGTAMRVSAWLADRTTVGRLSSVVTRCRVPVSG
jgi:hypothetical protein